MWSLPIKDKQDEGRKIFKCDLTCIVWVFPLLVTPYANIVPATKIEEWFNCKLIIYTKCNSKLVVSWRHKSLRMMTFNWNDQLKEAPLINRLPYKGNCMRITHKGNAPWSKWSSYLTFFLHWSCEGPSQLVIVCNDNIMWNQLLRSWISNL